MQSNVDLILASARTTKKFRLVTGDAPHEIAPSQMPALIVGKRRMTNIEVVTTNRTRYNGDWQYDIWIESDHARGHAPAEALLLAFLQQLNTDVADPWFEIVSDIEVDEGYHAQRMVIAAAVTLSIPSHYDLA